MGPIEMLKKLGLSEYEAKVYTALVGLGKASVREIHNLSGVPRARIYDVVRKLAEKGFVDIEDGEVKKFTAVEPRKAIGRLKAEFNETAEMCIKKLELMKSTATDHFSPALVIRGSIYGRIAEMIKESKNILVVTTNLALIKAIAEIVGQMEENRSRRVIIYSIGIGKDEIRKSVESRNVEVWSVERVTEILRKIYFEGLAEEGARMRIEAVLIFDSRKSLIVIDEGSSKSAVLITLPIIAYVQSNMIETHIGEIAERVF